MTTHYVSGRLVVGGPSVLDEEDNEQLRMAKNRMKFTLLTKQVKEEHSHRRMGEFKEAKSRPFVRTDGIGIDSDSDYEPEEQITSLSIGMLPEFIFNVSMFLKVCVGFFLFGNGLVVMRFKASVQSFMNPHFDSDYNSDTAPFQHHHHQEKFDGSIVQLSIFQLSWLAVGTMFVALFDIVFCLLLWHSVFHYKKSKIIPQCIILLVFELPLLVSAWVSHEQHECKLAEIREVLIGYLKRFGYDAFSTRKIHDLQLKLGCCGLTGWTDYEHLYRNDTMEWLEKLDTHSGHNLTTDLIKFYQQQFQTIVPFTCCKWPWNANLYCAKESSKWFDDMDKYKHRIEERFYTHGCDEKLIIYCDRIIGMLSIHMEIIYGVYLLLNFVSFLMVYFIMQKINLMKLEAESLYDFNKLEIYDNAFESDDSAEFDNMSEGAGDTKIEAVPSLKVIYDDMNKLETQGGLDDWIHKDVVKPAVQITKEERQRSPEDTDDENKNMSNSPRTYTTVDNTKKTEDPNKTKLEEPKSPPFSRSANLPIYVQVRKVKLKRIHRHHNKNNGNDKKKN